LRLILSICPTKSLAMPMPYPPFCPTFCPTKIEIFAKGVGHYHLKLTTQKICRTAPTFYSP
jgi:hypothetical protein